MRVCARVLLASARVAVVPGLPGTYVLYVLLFACFTSHIAFSDPHGACSGFCLSNVSRGWSFRVRGLNSAFSYPNSLLTEVFRDDFERLESARLAAVQAERQERRRRRAEAKEVPC